MKKLNELYNKSDNFSIVLNNENGENVEISDNEIWDIYVIPLYGERYILNGDTPLTDFFQKWIELKRYDYSRLYIGLLKEYNPIENYDRMEDWEDTGKNDYTMNENSQSENLQENTTTKNISNTNTTSKTGNDTEKIEENTQYIDYVTAFNNPDNFTENSKNVTTKSGDNNYSTTIYNTQEIDENSGNETFTNKNDFSEEKAINSTKNENNSNKHVGRVHGNIGLSTASDMLFKEFELRKRNLVIEILEEFIEKFTFFC